MTVVKTKHVGCEACLQNAYSRPLFLAGDSDLGDTDDLCDQGSLVYRSVCARLQDLISVCAAVTIYIQARTGNILARDAFVRTNRRAIAMMFAVIFQLSKYLLILISIKL